MSHWDMHSRHKRLLSIDGLAEEPNRLYKLCFIHAWCCFCARWLPVECGIQPAPMHGLHIPKSKLSIPAILTGILTGGPCTDQGTATANGDGEAAQALPEAIRGRETDDDDDAAGLSPRSSGADDDDEDRANAAAEQEASKSQVGGQLVCCAICAECYG